MDINKYTEGDSEIDRKRMGKNIDRDAGKGKGQGEENTNIT